MLFGELQSGTCVCVCVCVCVCGAGRWMCEGIPRGAPCAFRAGGGEDVVLLIRDKVLFTESQSVSLLALWPPASHCTSLAFRILSLEEQELKFR